MKKKRYKVRYYFKGKGEVDIDAENKEDVKDEFNEGNFLGEDEWVDEYYIDDILEI